MSSLQPLSACAPQHVVYQLLLLLGLTPRTSTALPIRSAAESRKLLDRMVLESLEEKGCSSRKKTKTLRSRRSDSAAARGLVWQRSQGGTPTDYICRAPEKTPTSNSHITQQIPRQARGCRLWVAAVRTPDTTTKHRSIFLASVASPRPCESLPSGAALLQQHILSDRGVVARACMRV